MGDRDKKIGHDVNDQPHNHNVSVYILFRCEMLNCWAKLNVETNCNLQSF